MLQPDKTDNTNGPRKVLDAPIHLASMTTTTNDSEELKSIWLQTRDDNFVSKFHIHTNITYMKFKNNKNMLLCYSQINYIHTYY